MTEIKDIIICPFCGMPTEIIRVHGHGQCKHCKMMLDECCSGENNQPEGDEKNNLNGNEKRRTDEKNK